MEPKVMTAQEAAEVLNVSLSTIYNLRDRGTLPQIKSFLACGLPLRTSLPLWVNRPGSIHRSG